jgi:hypothetical protein
MIWLSNKNKNKLDALVVGGEFHGYAQLRPLESKFCILESTFELCSFDSYCLQQWPQDKNSFTTFEILLLYKHTLHVPTSSPKLHEIEY